MAIQGMLYIDHKCIFTVEGISRSCCHLIKTLKLHEPYVLHQ